MNNWHTNKATVILKYLILFLFIGYYGSITFFYHAHIVDGKVIVHSHPFKNHKGDSTPYEKHQHNKGSYFTIDNLNKILSEEATSGIAIPEAIFTCNGQIDTPFILDVYFYEGHSLQLRAPPSISI